MTILWKKIEFYKGESDREVIVPLWVPSPSYQIFSFPMKDLDPEMGH